MKQTFVTPYNFVFNKRKHTEHKGGSSMTVPDQSYSIQDILSKFTRGVDPMLTKLPVWEDPDESILDEDYEDYDDPLTAIDRAKEFIHNTQEQIRLSKEMKSKQPEKIQTDAQDTIK